MIEAAARIKIIKPLENAGLCFLADTNGPAKIQLEPSVMVKTQDPDALGVGLEKASKGFIDFLLAANRERITRLEQKIQATLARIRGREHPPGAASRQS